jgi:type II secretory pathway pseudopilin PulG
MGLAGQADRRGELGYAMAALLVMLAIMAVLMTVAMPVWRHEAQREKEEEMVWRGMQYARAINAYQKKMRAFPPNLDVLVEGRYLRKKYKDPLTKDGEWQLIPAAAAGQQQGTPTGGIGGVTSKSQETSIRTFRGGTRYNLWQFTWNMPEVQARMGGQGGRGGDGRGGPGGGPTSPTPGGGRGPTGGFGTPGGGRPGGGFGQPGSNQPPAGGRGPGRGGRGF